MGNHRVGRVRSWRRCTGPVSVPLLAKTHRTGFSHPYRSCFADATIHVAPCRWASDVRRQGLAQLLCFGPTAYGNPRKDLAGSQH